MPHVKAPGDFTIRHIDGRRLIRAHPYSVFLAGSIEMGTAERWQDRVAAMLPDDWLVLNPRRDDWDNTIVQDPPSLAFREQVDWELTGLENVDHVALYLAPGTKSPISLLELGLCSARGPAMTICCPPGFWRRGNVLLVAERYDLPVVETLDELVAELKRSAVDGAPMGGFSWKTLTSPDPNDPY